MISHINKMARKYGRKSAGLVKAIRLRSLHCGLRAGEIFNLKGQDLNFDNGPINISDPKNKESRKAFMMEAVREALSKRIPKSPGSQDTCHDDTVCSPDAGA